MMKDLNPKFRSLALLQGALHVEDWALKPYSGTTGGHLGYGWKHDHLLSQQMAVDTLQCFMTRPAFYDDAPYRESSYLIGSRPTQWKPEDPGDLNSGAWVAPDGAEISGPDLEHFPISMLVSVARSQGYSVKTESGKMAADLLAKEVLRYLGRAHAGMLRTPNGLTSYAVTDRPFHYILRSASDSLKYGFSDPDSIATFADYLFEVMLPYTEKLPWQQLPRVYNGLHWALPALYDAWMLMPKNVESSAWLRMGKLLKAKALCCYQLASILPEEACTVDTVTTWGPTLTKEGISKETYYGPWGIRAHLVAAAILGGEKGETCKKAAMTEFAKWNGKPEGPGKTAWKCWAVDAEGAYLWW